MSKTELKRDILIAVNKNSNASNKQIANKVGCSASYVSQVRNEFAGYNSVDAALDEVDRLMDGL